MELAAARTARGAHDHRHTRPGWTRGHRLRRRVEDIRMRAGLMRERVTLLSKSVTRDAIGGEVITWVEEDDVWADVEQLTGREYFGAQQIESEAEIRFRI